MASATSRAEGLPTLAMRLLADRAGYHFLQSRIWAMTEPHLQGVAHF
jgi:hypothetical protein